MRVSALSAVLVLPLLDGPVRAADDDAAERMRVLRHGYGMLAERAGELGDLKKLLYVKASSGKLDDIAEAIASAGSDVEERLDEIARGYPAIRLDETGLPEVERKTRDSIGSARKHVFMPLLGESGAEFERILLLSQLSALEHQRHMAKVMAEIEQDESRREVLEGIEKRYAGLYRRVREHLEATHFCD